MITLGDILKITAFSTYLSQICLNVYYYEVNLANDLMSEGFALFNWNQDILANISAAQVEGVAYYRVLLEVLNDPLRYADIGTGVTGDIIDSGEPSAMAYSVKLTCNTRLTRPGGKRITGVPELWTTGNDVIAGAVEIAIMENAMIALWDMDTQSPDLNTAVPVVVGRLPEGGYDLTKINPISQAITAVAMTTQATRRPNKAP